MKLNTYLDRFTGPERRQFAERCELSYTHLSQLANHHRLANGKTCVKINQGSNGEVTFEDLRPDWYGGEEPKPAKRKTKKQVKPLRRKKRT